MTVVTCDEYWANGWRGPTVFRASAGRLHPADTARSAAERTDAAIHSSAIHSSAIHSGAIHIPGTVFAHLTDHHVHLGLINGSGLLAAGVTRVTDLGWIPSVAAAWLAANRAAAATSGLPDVSIAGAFLTCAHGYPSASTWAPAGSVRQVDTPADAAAAVSEQAAVGASVVKVVLNSVAGPVLDDDTLHAIVAAAHVRGLSVVAHTEGTGMAARALVAGADGLAHTPFTERLDDELLARMAAAGMYWISTLDIHGWGDPTAEHDTAVDNVRRFAAAGGSVRYGTDLGNGPLPVGVNPRELAALASAGLDRNALVRTIAGSRQPDSFDARFAWVPGLPPERPTDTADWLATARGCTLDTLEDTLS